MGSHLDGEMVHAVTEFWQLGAQREEVGQPRWPRRPRRGAQGPTRRHGNGKHLDAVVAFSGCYQYYTMWLLHKLTHTHHSSLCCSRHQSHGCPYRLSNTFWGTVHAPLLARPVR